MGKKTNASNKKVLARYSNRVMIVDDTVHLDNPDILHQKCIVIDTENGKRTPELQIGAWVKRMGPWLEVSEGEYTNEQLQKWLESDSIFKECSDENSRIS